MFTVQIFTKKTVLASTECNGHHQERGMCGQIFKYQMYFSLSSMSLDAPDKEKLKCCILRHKIFISATYMIRKTNIEKKSDVNRKALILCDALSSHQKKKKKKATRYQLKGPEKIKQYEGILINTREAVIPVKKEEETQGKFKKNKTAKPSKNSIPNNNMLTINYNHIINYIQYLFAGIEYIFLSKCT